MFVPPYFPEPLVVADNVADSPYDLRVRFVRQVSGLIGLFLGLVAAVAVWVPGPSATPFESVRMEARLAEGLPISSPVIPPGALPLAVVSLLLVQSLLRRLFNGAKAERWVAPLLLPVHALLLGWWGHELHYQGWPVAVVPLAGAGMAFYALICGRDFSFVGQFIVSLLVQALGLLAVVEIWPALHFSPWLAVGVGFVAQFYLVYDLAMILKRRRLGDQVLAICDVTCDPFNLLTYIPRVILRWRRFLI